MPSAILELMNRAATSTKELIMSTTSRLSSSKGRPSLLRYVGGLGCLAVMTLQAIALLLVIGVPVAILGVAGFAATQSMITRAQAHPVSTAPLRHVSLAVDILLNKPGGPADWPAYSPTELTVPANSLVTLTIRNFDLGDTPLLPAFASYSQVQGTQGSATVDGRPYATLDPAKVSHTFSIPALHLNVPIPGDAAPGADHLTVIFTFRTGAAGVYMWQCFDPCGQGPSGYTGPMDTMGFMMGTLTVQG